jgi:uncharacterized protein YndB with AHSA1/START domain
MRAREDRIEKVVVLDAPVSQVWRAITDHEALGTWFRVALDNRSRSAACRAGK